MITDIIYDITSTDLNKLKETDNSFKQLAFQFSIKYKLEYSSIITTLPTGQYKLIFTCHK